jgi:hypothetical protein
MKRTLVMLGLAVLAAVPVAEAQEVGRNLDTWTWDGRVESGKWFKLSSLNGPVSIEPSTDNSVHVRAEKIVKRGSVTDVAFQVVQSGGDVRICALWRRSTCDEDGMHSRGNNDDDDSNRRSSVEVRFTVKVPAGVRVSAGTVNGQMRVSNVSSDVRASTVNGRVEVENVGGEVDANTVNGSVNVSTKSGPVSAGTVNGDVKVRMNSLTQSDNMKFSTVNGEITLEAPENLNADVSIETVHGSISSDYPLQLSGRWGPRHASGTIGKGGPRIRFTTVNGSVELRKAR